MDANGDKITQQEEGIVPFNVPTTAANVTIFDKMPNALLATGPLVKAGCTLFLTHHKQKALTRKQEKSY